jgi:predicted dehydrogenase
MDDVEIVGHVGSSRPEAAVKAAQTWGGKAYGSVAELLAAGQVDAAWICVPPFAHGELERTFIEHKVPMYIEKPVGVDIDMPSRLAEEIAGSGLVVNVGYYWRCIEIIPKLRAMLAETPPRLVRIAYHGPTAPAVWWRQQAKSGGQVVEQATHLVDIARHLLGEAEVLSATASRHRREGFADMDIATATAALLRFDSGLNASFTASCVLGSFVDTAIEFLCEGRKITLSLKELTVDSADGRTVEPAGEDPLVVADRAFIAAVKAGDPSAVPCSYAEALETQRLCCAIRDQAEHNLTGEEAA